MPSTLTTWNAKLWPYAMAGAKATIVDALGAVYPSDLTRNALNRLNEMGLMDRKCALNLRRSMLPTHVEVTHLNIDLAHDCDMACGYCYLQPILQRVETDIYGRKNRKKAIDFLMKAIWRFKDMLRQLLWW